jgi:DNA-binding NtrC family response regulator
MSRPPSPEPTGLAAERATARIMVVDDDEALLRVLARSLSRGDWEVVTYQSAERAIEALRASASDVSAMLVDLWMPGLDGIELLTEVRGCWPELPVVLMTGDATVDSAIQALRKGAYDYLRKPFDVDAQLLPVIRRAVERCQLVRRNSDLERRLDLDERFQQLVGKSKVMRDLFALVRSVALSDASVLVLGETGTGKELVARAIHASGPRSAHPFVAINCGAFTETLLESELFGHVRGAYTGAVRSRRGLFEQATGGTLFLDEIGELSATSQARFLRVLDDGEVRPVGSESARPVDVRVIAATNRDLPALVAQGSFRQDLYYRINIVSLTLPPLRDRREDIPLLVRRFIDEHAARNGIAPRAIEGAALAMLSAYGWPGNVRELKGVVERALALSTGDSLQIADLSAIWTGPPPPPEPQGPVPTFAEAKAEFERHYLERVLAQADGSVTAAARMAGVDRSQLRRLLRRANLEAHAGSSSTGHDG